ncbi:uncharacterized protein LOC131302969 [Rhododendron vialii]|uniref:uncharacterized protein LOC131302969 n=1 Tax=Rhododendron vialii TaxID=182163 RepID=UPI00265EECC8|nr:uncharacterized protein LOC131302969 [Rhododendron vialii]
MAEFLADHPIDGSKDVDFTFPDEDVLTVVEEVWTLYFDGAANQKGFGIGVLLITPAGAHIPLAFKLNFDVINNQAEYEACIVRMEATIALGVEKLEVIGDSNLVVSQANGDWKIRVKLRPIVSEQRDFLAYEYVNAIDDVVNDGLPWYHDIWNFVERGEFPAEATKKDRIALQRLASQYIICGGKLYRRSHCGMHKLCVNGAEATRIMEEIHEGCIDYVRRCYKCQIHANLQHVPPSELYGMTSPWPFSVWGIDVIGMIRPSALNGHKFILVAIDYFTKWVEAESYKTLTTIHHSTTYRPQTNGVVEAANKNVEMIIKKIAEFAKDWHEQLPLALWGYRTSIRTSTGATPFSLVYGMEAVLPIKLEVPSLRIMAESGLEEFEWLSGRFVELMLFDERMLRALYHIQGYQRRIARAFNKKVKSRSLVEGDMVEEVKHKSKLH